MAIGQTNVSMDDILDEKAGNPSIPLNRKNISLYGLSVDNVADYQDASSNALIDIDGSPNQTAPYGMGEFRGYVGYSLSSFPSLSSGYTTTAMTGSTTSTFFNFQRNHSSIQYGTSVAAFGVVGFTHDTANDWIRITYYSGTNASFTTTYYQKIPYVGLAAATWEVQYQYPDITTAIPTYTKFSSSSLNDAIHPNTTTGGNRAENTYYSIPTSGQRQFVWRAEASYYSVNDSAQARVGSGGGLEPSAGTDVQFVVRATAGSFSATSTSIEYTINLNANRGFFAP